MSPQKDLWKRIEKFDLGISGARLSFTARLARDNGWTLDFARRVVLEYKRFLFLSCVAGHPITPSDEVDQAWHLHLTYSRSYWDELCGKVLERPFHHDPTRGGATEGAKFVDWYEKTRESYRVHFESEPPDDIWPPSKVRFGDAPHFRRVNTNRAWVVPKPRLFWKQQTSPGIASSQRKWWPASPNLVWSSFSCFGVALVLAGCNTSTPLGPLDWRGGEFLALFWGLAVFIGATLLVMTNLWRRPDDSRFPLHELAPYQLTRLSSEKHLTVDAALVSLKHQGLIDISERGKVTVLSTRSPRDPFEQMVLRRITPASTISSLRKDMQITVRAQDAELVNLGLLCSPETQLSMRISLIIGWGALLLLGMAKIIVGESRHRPTGFLAISCLAIAVLALVWLFSDMRVTKRGEKYIAHLRVNHVDDDETLASNHSRISPGTLVVGLALWGYTSLDGIGLTSLRRHFQSDNSSGGSSGDSSDGGSGCGGGCGGCGGGD